jgi:peptidyl-prolyl cis-trans isomerase C
LKDEIMRRFLAAAALAACSTVALAAPNVDPAMVVLENGDSKVTALDFDAAMTRFPENLRDEARAYPDTIMKMIDALFVNRVLAERARKEGIDKDPLVQKRMQQVAEAYLAQKYLEVVEKRVSMPNLDVRAEELYKADSKRFTEPPTASVSHLVVGIQGRSPEMALARAREAHAKIKAGAPFTDVAREYTDDPQFIRHKGDLGFVKESDLEPTVGKTIFSMKPGELSEPIVTRGGVHIVKVNARKEGGLRKFQTVKPMLVEEEQEKIKKRATEELLSAIRTDKANTIYPDRVDKLKSTIDPSSIDRVHRQAIEQIRDQQ